MPRGNGFLPVLFEITPVPYCKGDQVFNRALPLLFGQVVQPSLMRVYGAFQTLSGVTGPNGNGLVPSIFQVGLPLPDVNRHILVSHGKMGFLLLSGLERRTPGSA